MRTLTILVLLLASLAGCAATPAPAAYGSFVQVAALVDDNKIADDVAKKLAALYPPARTRFSLQHATPDAFGASLVEALRSRGFALAEFKSAASAGPAVAAPAAAGDFALAYVVDQPLDADLYRVTVLINSQSLSRVYQAKDGIISPAGYWVRKE